MQLANALKSGDTGTINSAVSNANSNGEASSTCRCQHMLLLIVERGLTRFLASFMVNLPKAFHLNGGQQGYMKDCLREYACE